MRNEIEVQEYRIVDFIALCGDIADAVLRRPKRKLLIFTIQKSKSEGPIQAIQFSCNGCRWEYGPHGGDQAEEMLILTGEDHERQKCEIQVSFRESSARFAYISPA